MADNLTAADKALRANLHLHRLEPLQRDHMERALCHVREAYIAVSSPGRARTVEQLGLDLDRAYRLIQRATTRPSQPASQAKIAP